MAGKVFNVSFNINGNLNGNLVAALQNAANAMRGLGNAAKSASAAAQASKNGLSGMAQALNNIGAGAAKFKALDAALKQTTADFSKSAAAIQAAKEKFQQESQAAEQLRQKLAQLNSERAKANRTKNDERAVLNALRAQRRALKDQYGVTKTSMLERRVKGNAPLEEVRRLAELTAKLRENQTAIEQQRAKFREAGQAYSELSAKVKQARADLQNAESAARQSGNSLAQVRANAQRLSQSFQSQLSALNQLKASLSAAGFDVSRLAQEESRLQSEINRVNAALQQQAALNQARANSSAATTELGMSAAGVMGAVYSAQQAMQPFKDATDKAIEFERVMSEVKALTQMDNIANGKFDVVEKEMAALTSQAKELGATTIYTAQQVGEAQAYIARTGWQTNQILGATPIFLKLAASQHMDIARTADIATNIMTAFGHSLESVGGDADKFAAMIQHDADVFAYTVTHSNQNFEQFGEAMKYAAPVAKNFGATIEEAAMMTKFMADAGIQGSMAGTSMRQTMLRLVAPPKKATKAMEQYGITLDDANAAWQNAQAVAQEYGIALDNSLTPGRQFISVMEQIDKNMASATDREKLAALAAITGINAVSGAANLFGAGANQARNFTELLENCNGALEQTYQVMTDNTFGAQKSFESAWEAVQLSVGESLKGIMRSGYETFAPILTGISQFIDRNPAVVQACAAIVAALSGIIISAALVKLAFAGWGFVAAQFELLAQSAAAFRLGLTGIAVEGGGIAGAMGLLGTKITALRTALFGLGGAATLGGWSAMFGAIAAKATAARLAVTGFFASLSLSGMASGAITAIKGIGTAIAGAARAAFAFAFSPVGVALMALALAGLYCYNNWEKVAPVLSNIAGIITGSLSGALQTIQPAIQAVMAAFENLGNALGTSGILSQLGMLVSTANAATQAAEIPAISTPAVDTSATQAALDAVGDSAQNAAANMDGVNQATQNISQVGEAFSQIPAAVQPAADGLNQMGATLPAVTTEAQNLSTAMQTDNAELMTHSSSLQANGAALEANIGALSAFGAACEGAVGGVTALGSAASSASSSVSGLGAAAQSACSQLAAAGANAAAQVRAAAANSNTAKQNYRGGIYPKGEFLTTFAEKGPEAAIPLDGSERAKDLWTRAGKILGTLPGRATYDAMPIMRNIPEQLFTPFGGEFADLMSQPAESKFPRVEIFASDKSYKESPPAINITFNLTINGNADENVVRRGVEGALPKVRDFAEELAMYQHEQARRSFA